MTTSLLPPLTTAIHRAMKARPTRTAEVLQLDKHAPRPHYSPADNEEKERLIFVFVRIVRAIASEDEDDSQTKTEPKNSFPFRRCVRVARHCWAGFAHTAQFTHRERRLVLVAIQAAYFRVLGNIHARNPRRRKLNTLRKLKALLDNTHI